jgi:hypothetical protein
VLVGLSMEIESGGEYSESSGLPCGCMSGVLLLCFLDSFSVVLAGVVTFILASTGLIFLPD